MTSSVPGVASARVGIVTGAGRGIGRAIAGGLAADGVMVVVSDRDGAAAQDAAEEIGAEGHQAISVTAAVDDPHDVEQMLKIVRERFGRLDVLVNNAGIASSGHSIRRTSLDEVRTQFQTHALGSFAVVQAALPLLRQTDDALVVFVSSGATLSYPSRSAPYTMAKAAMEALAWSLAQEERANGIRVCVLAPGMFDTRLGQDIALRLTKAGVDADHLKLLDPSELADVIRFLTTSAGRRLSGQRLAVGVPQ